jgi:hypothetical protein
MTNIPSHVAMILVDDGRDVRDVTDSHAKQGQIVFFLSLHVHAIMQRAVF